MNTVPLSSIVPALAGPAEMWTSPRVPGSWRPHGLGLVRKPLFLCLLALCSIGSALQTRAQIAVEVSMDQQYFLADEPLIVKIKIINSSGRTMTFGTTEDWVTLDVDSKDRVAISQLSTPNLKGEFSLESSFAGTKRVDLIRYYNLSQPGYYTVAANVRIPEWGKTFSSAPKTFSIVSGVKLWETSFGMPLAKNETNASPEIRKYMLQQRVTMKAMTLYSRVTDAAQNRTFKVTALGPTVTFTNPETQLDRDSNLHVLFQTGAKSFYYVIVSPDGEMVQRQTFEYTDTRPVMRADKEGKILISGGRRRVAANDLPKAPEKTPADDVQPPR